jgi:hypothetical protein
VHQLNDFRHLVRRFIAVSEQICDLQLRQADSQPVKKTALDGLLAAEILWDIEALIGRQSLDQVDLEALESAVRRQVLHLAGRAVEQHLKCRSLRCRQTPKRAASADN